MSEDQLERMIETRMDRLDKYFLNGKYDNSQYDRELRKLNDWADTQRKKYGV